MLLAAHITYNTFLIITIFAECISLHASASPNSDELLPMPTQIQIKFVNVLYFEFNYIHMLLMLQFSIVIWNYTHNPISKLVLTLFDF